MSVRNAILGLLSQKPRHGYELHASLIALAGGSENWDLKPAQVYTTLARLEESKLVVMDGATKESGPEKRVYSLTPAGRAELDDWLKTGVLEEQGRDEFFIKLMLGLEREDIDSRDVIHIQRSSLYQELHRITAQRQAADPQKELAKIMLLDKSVMHLEADLRWLEMIETRLDEIQEQPLPEPEMRPRGRPPKENTD
jgi:DNA-binding PadR family transcriptional regulator